MTTKACRKGILAEGAVHISKWILRACVEVFTENGFQFEANHSKALLNHIGERRVLSTLRHLCTPVQYLNWFEKNKLVWKK